MAALSEIFLPIWSATRWNHLQFQSAGNPKPTNDRRFLQKRVPWGMTLFWTNIIQTAVLPEKTNQLVSRINLPSKKNIGSSKLRLWVSHQDSLIVHFRRFAGNKANVSKPHQHSQLYVENLGFFNHVEAAKRKPLKWKQKQQTIQEISNRTQFSRTPKPKPEYRS